MVDRAPPASNGHSPGTLAYSQGVASRLSVTARKLRLTTSSRSGLFKAVGLRPRFIDRMFSAAAIAITLLLLVAPNMTALFYYGYLAHDQYQSETRFTVRSSIPALGRDQLAKVTGLPSAKIVQDTLIVTNYLTSGEILSDLSKSIDVRSLYGDLSVDMWSRLKADATSEELLDYWKSMVSSSVSTSSGIVTVKLRAFTPESAQTLLRNVVQRSEAVVNGVNDRIWKDVNSTAQGNLENAAAQLQTARERLQAARNNNGVLNVEGSSSLITTLMGNVQKEMLDLQQRYNSQLNIVSRDAPQMRVLQREIASKQRQIDDLKSQVAGATKGTRNLVDVSLDLSQIELDQALAERQFEASVKTFEQVKFVSKQQLVYLDAFLAPTLPEEAEYPLRFFWIGCTFVISFMAWGAGLGLLFWGRNRLY